MRTLLASEESPDSDVLNSKAWEPATRTTGGEDLQRRFKDDTSMVLCPTVIRFEGTDIFIMPWRLRHAGRTYRQPLSRKSVTYTQIALPHPARPYI